MGGFALLKGTNCAAEEPAQRNAHAGAHLSVAPAPLLARVLSGINCFSSLPHFPYLNHADIIRGGGVCELTAMLLVCFITYSSTEFP